MHSCPQCGDIVTKEQKFCSNCAWKVDSAIFDQEGIICTGHNDDGTDCGRQLTINTKFCPDCATPVKKADADMPVSDSNLSDADNPINGHDVHKPVGSTDSEVKQHNNGITHSTEQDGEGQNVPNQNESEDSMIKNSDVANGNSKEITSSTDSTPSDTKASVKLATGQKTPEPNSEGQKDNPDSSPESQELIQESKSASKEQTQEIPTSQIQIPDSDSKPFSHEQTGSNRDEDKMEVSSSQVPGSKNKTCHTKSTTDEPIPETPSKKLKLANERDSSRFKESSIKDRTVTTQRHSVFGHDNNQDKPTVSDETTTDSPPGPSSERFKDSFIFGASSNLTNPSYCKGESSSQKDDTDVSQGREDGHKEKDKTDKENTAISEKEGKQDEESTEDDSSDSKDSDSEKSDEDSKNLPASQKRKKDRKKNKKIKEGKKKERKKRKENKDGNSNTNSSSSKVTKSSTGNNSASTKSYGTGGKTSVGETTGSKKPEGKKPNTSSFIDVCFHAVISPTILTNPDKDFVVVTFEKYGGGWESKKYKLKLERPRADGYIVGTVTVAIPKDMVSSQSGPFYYNYVAYHEDGKNSKTFEYFHRTFAGRDLTEKGYKRTLSLPLKHSSKDIYHSYDGVVREDPRLGRIKSKNFWDNVKKFFGVDSYYKLLCEDAELAVSAFQPDWQLKSLKSDGLNGEQMILQVGQIRDGLRKLFVNDMSVMYGSDFDPIFSKGFSSHMKKVIHGLDKIGKEPVNIETKSLRLTTAVSVTYLINEYDVKIEYKEKRMLCEALLPMPDFENKTSTDLEDLKNFLPNVFSKVADSVLKFSRTIAGKSSDPCWMFCVPVIHFMLNDIRPFEEPTVKVNHNDSVPKWWGIDQFGYDIDHFKYQSKWDRSAGDMFKVLNPYFDVDYLLPRTLIASLKLEMLQDVLTTNRIPLDITIAVLYYYLRVTYTNLGLVKKLIKFVASKYLDMNIDMSKTGLTNAFREYRIAADLLEASLKYPSGNSMIHLPATEVFLITLDRFDKIQDKLDLSRNIYQQLNITKDGHLRKYDYLRGRIVNWLADEPIYKEELKFLKVWNAALSIKIPDGKVRDSFLKTLEERLHKLLQEKGIEEKLIEIYCIHIESFDGIVQEILSKVALKAVSKCSSFDWRNVKDERGNMRLGMLFSNVFERSWDVRKLDDPYEVLHHAVTWGPFPTYMEMFCNIPKAVTEDCLKLLKTFMEIIQGFINKLLQGNIVIKTLRLLNSRSGSFEKVLIAMKVEHAEAIMITLFIRFRELEAFDKTFQIVQDFTYICIHCKADTALLETKLKIFSAPDMVCLNKLVKTPLLENIKNPDTYQPIVTVFDLCPEELNILPNILECCKGLLFLKIWEKKGIEQQKQLGRNVHINEVFEKVWQPALEQWKTLSKNLKQGDMFFTDFEKWFKNKDSSTLEKEFRLLDNDGDTSWIKERLYQIKQHGNIRNYVHGAKAIIEVVNAFDLKGDFSQIQEIIKLTGGEDTVMKKLDSNLLDTCSILGGITQDRSECLQVFIKCKPLVDWIKESMPAGLKELKVFVDLASISAGEGDMEIAKVNCLHSATTGYAPLIFNLEKECDTKMFLEKCEVVWKELVPNPQLPQKLLDTTRQLEWLKSVKKSHGSVEVTSLAQAEAINGKGIYQVGNLEKKTFLKIPELTDVLELRVPEEEGNMAQRNHYRYDQLHDLQSRLMLVAGKAEKGKDDVDRFMLILDSVVRLGNIYKKLVTEGCVLFSQWHVKFLCDKDRKACAFINFGFGEERLTLKGRIDEENHDVSFIIPKLARFLEQCHEKWLDYIDQKREKYYCLNFFTIDQMVILQQELVKIGSAQEPAALIYPLMSAVKHGCTKDDLVKAMSAAKLDVDRADTERETQKEDEEKDKNEEKVEVSDDLKTQTFFNEMTKSGYPLGLAREALKHVEADDIDGGIVWCMDNEDEYGTEEQSMSETAPDEVPDFHGWTQTDQSLASITEGLVNQLVGVGSRENSVDKLIKTLEDLWKTFLVSISSSVSDYLSVEHLGIILNRLNEQDDFTVNRTLLPCFTAGEPNLLICPQSEIYNTVLSVYSHEVARPLPQSDEVLLCTPTTALDMLEIFWRRALFTNNDRVFCLVNADLLNYDVSDKGENSLERHLRKAESKGIKYRLVVICSSENEYRSRIVAALDKYHKPPLHTDVNMVRKYLLTKFKVDKSDKEWTPASTVDYERCSVRVVKSWRAGVGKSLYKKRMVESLLKQVSSTQNSITIPLHEKTLNNDEIMDVFKEEILPPQKYRPRIFHIDISHEVQEGVDVFLFQLLILGCLGHSSGFVWRRSELDYYIIESMPLLARDTDVQVKEGRKLKCLHHCLDILPHIICRSPQESLDILRQPDDNTIHDRLFDNIEFRSKTFQRPYQYLKRLDTNCKLDSVNPSQAEGDKKDCLVVLLRHCGIRDPSWSELYHFVSFLNKQLQDFEVSAFCCLAASEDLPGFSKFVLRFLIQMSRDFSTRSLEVSEESPIHLLQRQISQDDGDGEDVVQQYKMRRTWETSPHPYLFFNPDHHSMTFLGFNIERGSGNLIDQQTRKVLEAAIMQHTLFDALVRNRVNLSENFDALPRHEKINKLCNVMGLELPHDPDETYELTTDNVKKILAIYMRFRCDIPVIIMGETGCGKTRLIKFMCALQQPPGVKVENMILMKVHGGTKPSDIIRKVKKAEEIASKNSATYKNMDTVLFFDEANTTEAIGVIKEIMCDKSLGGKPINLHERLKIVAACNPYRKHSEKLIKRLEQAGLGYYVSSDKTTDKLGRIPMRHLVYRVQPLPQSMLPLVWDFGQLNTVVEEMYIKQMVLRYIKNGELPSGIETILSKILTVSQDFMRDQKDECSFVSLRDVERVLQMMSWFYKQSREDQLLFRRLHNMNDAEDSEEDSEDESMEVETHQQIDDVTRSLVLALGVCYHACLKNRKEYRDTVAKYFTQPLVLPGGADQIEEEISKCQSVFLDSVSLAPNIARNQALKENVFMMIVCIELRIPMFLVGKPGSSKSLAKTIVADAMQGNAAQNELFKNYKQVQMVSFQCSHLSVPEGIVGTFRQCANFQKGKPLDRFVSIVVLDEIGLAEDSPRMPLKTLHPLLEDGCPDDEEPADYKKVAFIGISNWALDPAKMNRGILVQREVPDITELIESARGICTTKKQKVLKYIEPMIHPMADSYLALFKEASTEMREFFGLRDFYSLLKMLYGFVSESKRKPTWFQLQHSILRNFGGLENVKPVDIFCKKLAHLVDKNDKPRKTDPDCTPAGMIQACLTGQDTSISETRYLLLLTENYGALTILQQKIFTMENAVVIFGSSFPSDQEYTQVCRNINRIKVCMETGSTVILLNLENLYESLYDALNQYYVEFGGERYVDLGLGSHRVKCRVHRKFRLIVVAEKQIVYDKFPIPLINRLEKHFLSLKTMLTPSHLKLTVKLQEWAQQFCEVKVPMHMRHYRQKKESRQIGDAFMGYHDDTCAAIILYACLERECNDQAIPEMENEILKDAEGILLWCATPAAVLELEDQGIFDTYFSEQNHESLADYLRYKVANQKQKNIHAQITTNSKLLSIADIDILCRFLPILRKNIVLLNLQSFDTEQQFSRQIKSFLDQTTSDDMLLIIQCDSGDQNGDLIACARNTLQDELQQIHHRVSNIHVVLLIQLPGIAGGCFTGFQCGLWHSVHIDDIHPAPQDIPSVAEMSGKSVSALLDVTKDQSEVDMEIERDQEDRDIETMETNEEIDLMDIYIEEKAETKKQFKIDYLIKKCIQPALGNVKDPKSDETRAVDRLKIILNWMQVEEGQMTVLSGIAKHMTGILKEKEQNIGRQIRNWLTTEATKPENLNRAGTFRNFAVQCLEAKVIPVLAGIIAFMDTNRNLDILENSSDQDWQVAIWLQILNDPELTQLKYSLMVSPTRLQELQEITVKTTSVDGRVFSAKMPFSWIIFGQIEDVLRNSMETKEVSDSDFDVVLKASDIFQSLPLGILLSGIEGTYIHQVLKAYIQDFVYMVHPVQSDPECNLICESLIVGCKHLLRGEFGRLLPSILGCHMTFILQNTRFKNFSHIVHVWPGCSQKTLEFQQNQSSFYLVTEDELTLDVLALHMLVDNLEPNRDDLNKIETRTKWLRRVCDYRPVVERIIGHFMQDVENREYHYGDRCQKGIENARYQWTRVVVVKLFIEHVCTTDKDEISIKRCMPFWGTLREGADMKDLKSLEKVEKFIKHCNKDVVTQCFGKQTDCVSCETMIDGAPVRLPCSHVMCRKCFLGNIQLKEYDCPDCRKKFPEDLDPDKTDKELEMKKYHDYRRRCNSFFMEVVSQLCFADGTPPSKEVIDKLLSYITGQSKTKKSGRVLSKELTIFDDTIDPTPVVRSFLLQQLMQTSSDHEIQNHLSAYFTLANDVVKTSADPHNSVELCLLVLQCMEDSLHQQYKGEEEVTVATQMLREAVPYIVCDSDVLDKIDHIARVRFSLTVVARHIHRLYGTSKKSMPDEKIRRMFEAAAKLCDECKSPWPRRYFVKQLCRCHGIDSYHTVIANSEASFLKWVCLPELQANEVKECHDRYIVIGDEYKQLREIIVTTILSENSDKIDTLLKSPQNEWQCRVKLNLALHREICMNKVTDRSPQKFTEEGINSISKYILSEHCQLITDKDFAQRLLNNEVWKLKGNIIKGMDLAQQNVFCLLTHYMILMSEIPGKTTLLTPLQKIALDPTSMVNSFFPTMPQDEIQEIKEALLAARDKTPNENPVFYRCPTGHPYVIGDCGRPYYLGHCKECGLQIGGERHVLRPDNVIDSGGDRTETGHILGRATNLGPITAPERQLNRASFSILRLLTHISMYIGANNNIQAVGLSIKPNIEETEVGRYILEHIDLDMTSIQNILGKNKDDILLLIHHLLARMMEEHTMAVIGENYPADMCGLLNKKSRSKWEEEFAKKYITPVLQNMDQVLKQSNGKIQKDQRLGADALLQILYETDKVQENQDILKLQEIPGVWRYRDLISINHLGQNLERSEEKLPVLRLFLKEEHHLRAIRFIPSIMRLQRMLIQKYGRKLDRAEATTLKIQDVKQEMEKDRKIDEFEQLLKDFTEAWSIVKESLKTTVCLLENNVLAIDKSYFRSAISDDTPISYLIPTYRDAGLCSYILLYFLLKKQNMFIEQYCYQRRLSAETLPQVHVKDISSAHLISYHPDKDLLPMVLANCNYTFEVGQGTRIEYNFTNLERQLMDRFLFSKSIITGIAEIETITYRSESTNAVVFKTLCDKVQQERLSPAVRSQICAEIRMKHAADLWESLDKLDIAISFLKSVGSDPDNSLSDFITNTLKIDNPFSSPKAQQSSRCKHTMSLWMTLALERAKEIAKNNRKAFEGISENFKKNLTEEQRKVIFEIISSLPIEQIDTLVEVIFECIVFKVDVPQDDEEEELFSKVSFHDTLIGYMDTCPYEEDKQLEETLKAVIDLIPSDDQFGVVTCQSVELWHLVQKIHMDKQKRKH
ncbi:E3 ubiquitin-protein ligase rnf213-alpha-like isoform X2 [Mytilus californianus]|uniref:E3 ubiquitin-protein ligase rnf213-alpha-like isoform X2 n=1 Tax=Mytilus californianus TaxID=6549 RepID=UPI0022455FAE|nr:E3 ubiquitin-protein ligase rnf213-alpha-like isoform X2 [Mytilus californianus]